MEISTSFLNKYNKQGPRYTSYPTATAFKTDFSSSDFFKAIELSNSHGPQNISIYIHIPFCTQRCFFCGCNTTLFESNEKVARYIDCLKKEIETLSLYIDKSRLVTQIHWGGGTPNSIDLSLVRDIMDIIRSKFVFADFCEIAMECNPAYLDFSDIDILSALGFNRISLGIQDFNVEILNAINRKPPLNDISTTIKYLKEKGFKGANLDLIYGLPLQSVDSFKSNIYKVIELKPDRLVTFSYAHVPWFNPEQNKLDNYNFPSADEKLNMLVFAINTLSENGYETIGMDHFAKPNDELAIAKQAKALHRNFQGYCTKKTTGQVYAFGASAISQLEGCYAQNIKTVDAYISAVEANGNAIERGYLLSENECIIRDIINEVMCNGFVDFLFIAAKYNRPIAEVFKITQFNISKIKQFIDDGLVDYNDNKLTVSPIGMLIVRNIAMAFDPDLESTSNKHSQTI